MENSNKEAIAQLIIEILSTAPYQLPPVVHSEGCFTVDIVYLDRKLTCVSISLEDALRKYLHHVTKADYEVVRRKREPLLEIPVPMGRAIYQVKE